MALIQFLTFRLHLVWLVLAPCAALLGTLPLARAALCAYRRGLARMWDVVWLSGALAASQVLIWATLASALYETSLLAPLIALGAVSAMIVATRLASRNLHPGLRAFIARIPADGLLLLAQPESRSPGRRLLEWSRWRLTPTLPALFLGLFVLLNRGQAWLALWSILPVLVGPALIVPLRRIAPPTILLLAPLLIGLRAWTVQERLPPGQWITPVTSAGCTSSIRLAPAASHAWCADHDEQTVIRFFPQTGEMIASIPLAEVFDIIAGGTSSAWAFQLPARGVVRIDTEARERTELVLPRRGAADIHDRAWIVDAGSKLGVIDAAAGTGIRWMGTADGLVSNTAQVVRATPDGSILVGSVGGLSIFDPAQSAWQTFDRSDGIPGPVYDIAIAPDDSVWIRWTDFGSSQFLGWGVSQLLDGEWSHYALGRATGLDAPASRDSLAVDAAGRVWVAGISYAKQENILAIFDPATDEIAQYSLGSFVPANSGLFLLPSVHGIVADGDGGVYVYNPTVAPLRHWRPD